MLRVVGEFSAVTAVVLSLLRKVLSLLVSYAIFPKDFTVLHASGLLLVFGAGTLHSFRRQIFESFEKAAGRAEGGTGSAMKAMGGSVEDGGNSHPEGPAR
jgi:hypothetical protein